MSKDFIESELKEMGKMSSAEKISAAVLTGCVLLWAFENVIGVSSHLTALGGMVILMIAGAIDGEDFKSSIPWDVLLMVPYWMVIGLI